MVFQRWGRGRECVPPPREDRRKDGQEMRCRYREITWACGPYLDVRILPVFKPAKGGRSRKWRPTPKAQARLNEYNSQQKLRRLIEANFTSRDYWVTPTFRPDALPQSPEELLRIFQNFIRRLKRIYAKRGVELKYIAILEQSDRGRYHVHMIINRLLTPDELRDAWGLGRVRCDALIFDENGLSGLANYMTKYRMLTKRYLRSRNLIDPKPVEQDRRYSQREVAEIMRTPDDAQTWERLYPGYTFLGIRPYYNEIDGKYYIGVRMWRPPRQ